MAKKLTKELVKNMAKSKKSTSFVVGAAVSVLLGASGAHANDLFSAKAVQGSYVVAKADSEKHGGKSCHGDCEGKCGADKKSDKASCDDNKGKKESMQKDVEMKCGEGKCGSKK